MKKNKNIDDPLRKALGAYEEKPRLSFETLQNSYLNQKKIKLKSRITFLSFTAVTITALVTAAYLFLSEPVAQPEQIISVTAQKQTETSVRLNTLQMDKPVHKETENHQSIVPSSTSEASATPAFNASSGSETFLPESVTSTEKETKQKQNGNEIVKPQSHNGFSSHEVNASSQSGIVSPVLIICCE